LECRQQIENKITVPRFSFERTSSTPQCDGRIEGVFSYISADRYGPRNSLPLNIEGGVDTVGCFGENIVDFLSLIDDELLGRVPEILVLNENRGVGINIQEWLRLISPGVKFEYERDAHTDTGRTEFNGHRPVHVGFGLSYALPVIASILIHSSQLFSGDAAQGLLLIENPEAHLHPSGQTMMGKMLGLAASCGLQIVVETHSDHLLNGVRIAVKEGKISHTNVKCYFFKSNEENFSTIVEGLSIDKHGMLDYWPDGFFDESEKNLMKLI
jgi:predicted ATPase